MANETQAAATQAEKAQAAIDFTKFEIETDGTAKGTVIKLNGKAIDNLGYISMSFYNDGLPCPLSLGFTTNDPNAKPGTLVQKSFFSLICPSEDDAQAAKASLKKQPTVPTDALPRNQRQNLYAQV